MTLVTIDKPPIPPPLPLPAAPAAPLVALRAAGIVGVAAAVLLTGGPPGIGVPLLGLVAAAALLPLAARRYGDVARRGWRITYLVTAFALLSAAAVRDADWVVALNLVAAAGLASLALVPWRSWAGVLLGLVALGTTVPSAAGWLLRGVRRAGGAVHPRAGAPVLRGIALAAVLLAAFVPLLVSADAAFAELFDRLFPAPPTGSAVAGRLFAFTLGSLVAGAAAGVLLLPRTEPHVPPPARLLERTSEWLLPLAALTTLLGAFVGLQAQVAFGRGSDLVSRTGLTYAEYARSGFWQLLAVTALVLAVVAAAGRWTPRGPAVCGLLRALCVLGLYIDASSLHRLSLYVEEYGLTRLRVLAATICLWLAVVLVAVLVAGTRRGDRRGDRPGLLPQVIVLSAAAVLLVLAGANPDAWIARSALDRGDRADLAYLSTLSADAVPVLDRLPPTQRSCALRDIALRLGDDGWTSANWSRSRARDIVAERRLVGYSCSLLPG